MVRYFAVLVNTCGVCERVYTHVHQSSNCVHISLQFHVEVHVHACASVPGLPLEYSLYTVGTKEEMDKLMKEREDEVTERREDIGHESSKEVKESEEHVGRVDGSEKADESRTTKKPKKRKQPQVKFYM